MTKQKIDKRLETLLEQMTLEELLEEFDVTPTEVFELLYDEGMLDEELFERLFDGL